MSSVSSRNSTSAMETNEIFVCAKPVSPDMKAPAEQTSNQHGDQAVNDYKGSIYNQVHNGSSFMGVCRDQADNQYRNISSNRVTRSYKRCNSGYKNSYNRQHQQHGQEATNSLDFQYTTVPQIVHAPNIFSFSGYQCATMIPLYPPKSLSFSGLYLMIPLFR